MQQALYTNVAFKTSVRPIATPESSRLSLARRLAQRWDLYGVVALMASSAAYGLFSLLHLA